MGDNMKIELLGGCTKEELEARVQKVAAAGKLSRFPGNVFEVIDSCDDYESNLKLVKRIIKMGHKSIIEHDDLVFALCDVTPIIEQTIIGNRLTSFTIKSRREVDFRNVGFYIPEFRNENLEPHKDNEALKEKYVTHMKELFNIYGDIVDSEIKVEDARFVLPYCYHSNIIMGLDARELEKMILAFRKGRLSRIQELKELGDMLYDIAKEYIPYLPATIKQSELTDKNDFEYLESMVERPEIKIIPKTNMISYTKNADDVILESMIMYHYQCSEKKAKDIIKEMVEKDPLAREKLMDNIVHKKKEESLNKFHLLSKFQFLYQYLLI